VRAVVQRVRHARIRVGEEVVADTGPGLLALVGVAEGDQVDDARQLAEKLVHLRVFEDAAGKMNRSLLDVGGALAIVSQFTLLGDCRKGRRPSYHQAARPDPARALVDTVVAAARQLGVAVETGRFQARMEVELVNEGPVTLLLDTRGVF